MVTSLPFLMLQNYPNFWFYPDTHALAQIHKEPTREENILDLLITNKPGLIKSSHSVPGISDHCAVVTELDIDPPYRCTKPRPVRQVKKANWEAIRQQIRSCWTSFSENSPSRSVNENWLKLKSILNQCLNKFIPTKMTSPRENLPWLSKSLEKIQRSAARFVTQNYRQTASVTSLIQNLGWTDLKTRRKNSRLVSMFKILNELVEIHINDRLIPADRRTRGGHSQAYKHLRANTTLGQDSFWHRTIPDWNSLPAAAIESKTVAAFKSQLVD